MAHQTPHISSSLVVTISPDNNPAAPPNVEVTTAEGGDAFSVSVNGTAPNNNYIINKTADGTPVARLEIMLEAVTGAPAAAAAAAAAGSDNTNTSFTTAPVPPFVAFSTLLTLLVSQQARASILRCIGAGEVGSALGCLSAELSHACQDPTLLTEALAAFCNIDLDSPRAEIAVRALAVVGCTLPISRNVHVEKAVTAARCDALVTIAGCLLHPASSNAAQVANFVMKLRPADNTPEAATKELNSIADSCDRALADTVDQLVRIARSEASNVENIIAVVVNDEAVARAAIVAEERKAAGFLEILSVGMRMELSKARVSLV